MANETTEICYACRHYFVPKEQKQGGCRRFETFQLLDDDTETLRAFHLMIRCDLLPGKQITHEIGGGNGLDFLPQSVESVTVNAREQAARTPLGFRPAGRELPANHKTFGFEFE